jgi:hypothetical protein
MNFQSSSSPPAQAMSEDDAGISQKRSLLIKDFHVDSSSKRFNLCRKIASASE